MSGSTRNCRGARCPGTDEEAPVPDDAAPGGDDDVVLCDVVDRIATIPLNRPAVRNALNTVLLARLPEVMNECEARDDVDVLILTGADPAFSAGIDLKE